MTLQMSARHGEPHTYRRRPTPEDPVLVATSDQQFLWCWVEHPGVEPVLADAREPAPRWILLDADGTRTAGPAYHGENSIDTVRTAVSEWLRVSA